MTLGISKPLDTRAKKLTVLPILTTFVLNKFFTSPIILRLYFKRASHVNHLYVLPWPTRVWPTSNNVENSRDLSTSPRIFFVRKICPISRTSLKKWFHFQRETFLATGTCSEEVARSTRASFSQRGKTLIRQENEQAWPLPALRCQVS